MFKPLFLITFLLLIFGGGLFIYQDQTNYTKPQNSNFGRQKLLEQLDTKALYQIKIQEEGSVVSLLQLQGGGWREQSLDYDADILPIQDLLLNLSQIRLGDLVTNNPDHHARFQLLAPPEKLEEWNKDRHANSITLLRGDGTLILSLLLGKERIKGEGQYVRHTGSDKIYLIPEQLTVDSAVEDWLKKDLLSLESKQIASLKLENGKDISFSVSRESAETDWKSANENANLPDSERITKALDRLSGLSFSKLLKKDFAPEELEGSDNAEETLLVSLFDGRIFTLNLQKNDVSYENYILTMRMGILQGASESANAEDSIIRQEMDVFNKRVNGRFFEISSWVGKELLLSDQ